MNDRPSSGPGTESPPAVGSVRLGDLDRVTPISRRFGGDRGTPLDRSYIEAFLSDHAADIRGRVLEVGENLYTKRFGANRVTRSDVVDVDPGNAGATYIADLTDCEHVPSASFDCIILTQTLHMIFDVHAVVATIRRLLAPGGTVLATVPGISQIDSESGRDTWYWSMTPLAARLLFEKRFSSEQVLVEAYGNVLAAVAFLHGIALEEIDPSRLAHPDPLYPVIVGVRAVTVT